MMREQSPQGDVASRTASPAFRSSSYPLRRKWNRYAIPLRISYLKHISTMLLLPHALLTRTFLQNCKYKIRNSDIEGFSKTAADYKENYRQTLVDLKRATNRYVRYDCWFVGFLQVNTFGPPLRANFQIPCALNDVTTLA